MSEFAPSRLLGSVLIALVLGACGTDGRGPAAPPPPGPTATISVSPSVATLGIGATVLLQAKLTDASGAITNRPVVWTSSNPAVALVAQTGLVTGTGAGTATINATSDDKTAAATITVSPALVASVQLVPSTASATIGGTVQLSVILRDAAGNVLSGRTTTWSSANLAIATVDNTGLVRGAGAGTVSITATSEGRSGTALVNVTAAPVPTITIAPPTATVNVGATLQLTATLRDASGNLLTGRTFTWSSSNAAIASIDNTGRVRGVAAGSANITATAEGVTGAAAITVNAPAVADTVRIALTDMGTRTYRGFTGGLYPDGSNALPTAHAARGLDQARQIRPLDVNGRPTANGKYVLLSIGMSNTTQEFCAAEGTVCAAWSFSGQAARDATVNRTSLVLANGAMGGQTSENWDSPSDPNYARIRDQVLAPAGLTEAQVQIVWVKVARAGPRAALPAADADAYINHQLLGSIARALKTRYPNLRQMFVSSRIYAGFATTALNPEPYAYEIGFSNKWLIESQIRQLDTGAIDARPGNLSLSVAPWIAWGPYLWAGDSAHRRIDGFFWSNTDFGSDGTHPSQAGEQRVGAALLNFFKSSAVTSCWFLAGRVCS